MKDNGKNETQNLQKQADKIEEKNKKIKLYHD